MSTFEKLGQVVVQSKEAGGVYDKIWKVEVTGHNNEFTSACTIHIVEVRFTIFGDNEELL